NGDQIAGALEVDQTKHQIHQWCNKKSILVSITTACEFQVCLFALRPNVKPQGKVTGCRQCEEQDARSQNASRDIPDVAHIPDDPSEAGGGVDGECIGKGP